MQWEIPFKEGDENNTILVNDNDILDVRRRLSELGLPLDPSPGMEIFSESEYGMSEFTQRVNFQRAIESEIAKTIRTISGISGARVHLTIPKESIFKDRTSLPKASVTLKLQPGTILSNNQIYAVQELVASSVDKLTPRNVIVLNENGTLYNGLSESTLKNNQNKQELELSYTKKAFELAREMVKTDSIQVAVDIEYNYDKIRSIKEEVIPGDENNSGYLVKAIGQTSKQSNKDQKKVAMDEVSEEKEYIYSKERSEIEYSAGKIQRVSVGIVVSKQLDTKALNDLQKLVSAGLGLTEKRGDQVVVVTAPPIEPISKPKRDIPIAAKDIAEDVGFKSTKNYVLSKLYSHATVYYVLAFSAVSCFIVLIISIRRIRSKPRLDAAQRELFLRDLRNWVNESSGAMHE